MLGARNIQQYHKILAWCLKNKRKLNENNDTNLTPAQKLKF